MKPEQKRSISRTSQMPDVRTKSRIDGGTGWGSITIFGFGKSIASELRLLRESQERGH